MTRTTVATLILLSVGISNVTARAASAETRSSVVRYADLNLTGQAGQDRLGRRIAAAAADVCSMGGGTQPLSYRAAERRCRAKSMNDATVRMAAVIDGSSRLAARSSGSGVVAFR